MNTSYISALAAALAGGALLTHTAAGVPDPIRSKNDRTLMELIAAEPSLSTFGRLLKATGLEETLRRNGPYTVLAPTDAAFRMLPEGDLQELVEPANRDRLIQMISYHIALGSIPTSTVSTGEYVTLQGSRVVLNREGGVIWVGPAEVMKRDIAGSKGNVIHIINMVLEPDEQ